jgi:hypothetical protein
MNTGWRLTRNGVPVVWLVAAPAIVTGTPRCDESNDIAQPPAVRPSRTVAIELIRFTGLPERQTGRAEVRRAHTR